MWVGLSSTTAQHVATTAAALRLCEKYMDLSQFAWFNKHVWFNNLPVEIVKLLI